MKWLIIAPEVVNENIKQIEDFLEAKNCEYDEIFISESPDYISSFGENLSIISQTTHCVVIDADKMAERSEYAFTIGYLAGKNIRAFLHSANEMFLNHQKTDYNYKNYVTYFKTVDEMKKSLDEKFDLLVEYDKQHEALVTLLTRGIPFTADSFAHYIEKENAEICQIFEQAGIDVNAFTSEGVPLLCVATRTQNESMLNWLLSKGAEINAISKDRGYSPVMDAVWRKNYDMTKLLVEKGADLNIMSTDGQPILVLAVGNGNSRIVEILVKNGADPNVKDSMGMSALEYAKLFKKDDLVEIIENNAGCL